MDSFYGGRPGRPFNIASTFSTSEALNADLRDPASPVAIGDYAALDVDNGPYELYQKGVDASSSLVYTKISSLRGRGIASISASTPDASTSTTFTISFTPGDSTQTFTVENYGRVAEAWAQGTMGGESVPAYSSSNAKYYSEQAFSAATSAASSTSDAESYKNAAFSAAGAAASSAESAATLAASAETSAAQAANSAEAAASSATDAASSAEAATSSAEAATSSAEAAASSATDAASSATDAANSAEAATSSAEAAASSATDAASSAEVAQGAASGANSAKDTAVSAATIANGNAQTAEAWAVGKRNGVDVSATDPAYQNNAKYYKDQAQAIVGDNYVLRDKVATVQTTTTAVRNYAIGEYFTYNGDFYRMLVAKNQGSSINVANDSTECVKVKVADEINDRLKTNYIVAGQKSGTTLGNRATAEGNQTIARDFGAHAEGGETIANDKFSHAEGYKTTAANFGSHAEGGNTQAESYAAHAEGDGTKVTSDGHAGHAEGYKTTAAGFGSHAEGNETEAEGYAAHAEGSGTTASGYAGHAEGAGTTVSNYASHAEGFNTTASGYNGSHAEGYGTTASGNCSHAEGFETTASQNYSHAEGYGATASGTAAHAEGYETTVSGFAAHAEGYATTASGRCAHVEGEDTEASGKYSHAEGHGTFATHRSQHVFGENNIADDSTSSSTSRGNYVEIVGNGEVNPSNARTLDWSGNEWVAGTIKVGGTGYSDGNAKKVLTTGSEISSDNVIWSPGTNPLNTDQLTLGMNTVYFTAYPDLKWCVDHLDGDYAYLGLYNASEQIMFGGSVNYNSSSTIVTKCTTFLNNTIPNVADYLESVTINGVTNKVFIPSYKMFSGTASSSGDDANDPTFDWPSASTNNRIACVSDWSAIGGHSFWLSSPFDSGNVWRVDFDGAFSGGSPTGSHGFRPEIKVKYKGFINKTLTEELSRFQITSTDPGEGSALTTDNILFVYEP